MFLLFIDKFYKKDFYFRFSSITVENLGDNLSVIDGNDDGTDDEDDEEGKYISYFCFITGKMN